MSAQAARAPGLHPPSCHLVLTRRNEFGEIDIDSDLVSGARAASACACGARLQAGAAGWAAGCGAAAGVAQRPAPAAGLAVGSPVHVPAPALPRPSRWRRRRARARSSWRQPMEGRTAAPPLARLPPPARPCSGGGAGPGRGARHDAQQRLPLLHRARRPRGHAGEAGERAGAGRSRCLPGWAAARVHASGLCHRATGRGGPVARQSRRRAALQQAALAPPPPCPRTPARSTSSATSLTAS